jgi:protein PhnA
MAISNLLKNRCQDSCELCSSTNELFAIDVPPVTGDPDDTIAICLTCQLQIEKKAELDAAHWQCLHNSMWSEVPAVQVVSWRMLNRLRSESWAADLLDMLFLEEARLEWAKASGDHENDEKVQLHRDCHGQLLQDGDTVVLTKSLDVKGSTLNARLGTVVRNIRLVRDNVDQIEGRIEGQLIVILTKYLRKQGG